MNKFERVWGRTFKYVVFFILILGFVDWTLMLFGFVETTPERLRQMAGCALVVCSYLFGIHSYDKENHG